MLTEELLRQRITKGRFDVTPLTASHSGYALAPHGGCGGMLYDYAGSTYLIPFTDSGRTMSYQINEVRLVTNNPTGWFKDMTLEPVAAEVLQGGLEAALKAAIQARHPKAGRDYQLAFN